MTIPTLLLVVAIQAPVAGSAQAAADTNDPLGLYEAGLALLQQRNTPAARSALQQAVRIDGKMLPAWIALLRVLRGERHAASPRSFHLEWRGGRPVFVAYRWGDSLRFATLSDSLRYISRRIFLLNPLVQLPDEPRYLMPFYWKETLTRAMRSFGDRKYEQAIAVFDTVIMRTTRKNNPEAVDPYSLWHRAMAQIELGRFEPAIADLQRLLDRAFRDSTAAGAAAAFELEYTLAYVNQKGARLDEAARIYRQLLQDNLGVDIGHSHLADILEQQGKLEAAAFERRYARDANPEDPSFHFDLGLTLVNLGRGAEAEEVLGESLAANPREVRAYYLLGIAHQLQSETAAAREAWTRFLELAPKRYASMSDDARRRLAALQ